MADLSDYKIITSENGIVGRNIVVQHLTDNSIAYIQNSKENRKLLGIHQDDIGATEDVDLLLEADTADWHENSIKTLLSLYLEYVEDFRNPKCKKKEIWKKISDEIGISLDACHRKFRNLKQHYLHILRQRRRPGKGRVPPRWPYFELLDEIFQDDPSIHTDSDMNITVQQIDSKREPTPLFAIRAPVVTRKRFLNQNEVKNRKRANPVSNVQSLAEDMNRKQIEITSKLDELIEKIQESNNIQIRRNELFERYIEKIGNK